MSKGLQCVGVLMLISAENCSYLYLYVHFGSFAQIFPMKLTLALTNGKYMRFTWDYKHYGKKWKLKTSVKVSIMLAISVLWFVLKSFTCSAILFTHFLYFGWSQPPSYMCVFLTEPQDVPPGSGKWSIFSSCTSVLLVISLVPPFFPYFLNQVHGKDISSTQFLTFALLPLASCRCSSTIHGPREEVAIVTAFAEAARQDVHLRRVFHCNSAIYIEPKHVFWHWATEEDGKMTKKEEGNGV